jgi:hypothetical protein
MLETTLQDAYDRDRGKITPHTCKRNHTSWIDMNNNVQFREENVCCLEQLR